MQTPSQPQVQRVALYARVSTEDQADRGTIEAQRAFLAKFAGLYQLDVADEYVDDGYSGTSGLEQRPEGRRLLDDARRGAFTTVLVYRLDRLGRSLRALLDAHDALERAGVTVRSATEPFDTSTPIGKFLFQLLASLAELEKSTIAERTTMGRDRVARTGKWTGGPVPFGYELDGSGRLIPSARVVDALGISEADLVRQIFQRVAEGSSGTAEALRLRSLGIPCVTRYAGGKVLAKANWEHTRVSRMLRNPLYAGRHVLKSRMGPVECAVTPLVTTELFDQVARRLLDNRNLSRSPDARPYPLTGLIVCGTCGVRFGGAAKARTRGEERYYRCNASQSGHRVAHEDRCRAKYVRAQALEDTVWQDCRNFILNPGDALAEAKRQLHETAHQAANIDQTRRRLERLLSEKEVERERVMTLFRRGHATLAEAESQLDALGREVSDLRTELEVLQAQHDISVAFQAQHAAAEELLTRLAETVEEIEQTNDTEKKREIMQLLVSKIVVDTSARHTKVRHARVMIQYAFAPERALVSHTGGRRTSGGRGRSGPAGGRRPARPRRRAARRAAAPSRA